MSLANTLLTNTFDEWRVRTNLTTTRVNSISPSVNTISANSVTSNTLVITGGLTIPNTSIASTKVTFLANTNAAIATKLAVANAVATYETKTVVATKLAVSNAAALYETKATADARLANTNAFIATKIAVANAISKTTGSINSNTYFTAGVVDRAAIGESAVGTGELVNNAVTIGKVNVNSLSAGNTVFTHKNNQFSKSQYGAVLNLGVYHGLGGNTVSLTLTDSNHYSLTTNANLTIANPSGLNPGQGGSIVFTSNGNFTVSWGSFWRFREGTVPTFSTVAGKQDRIDYYVVSSNTIHTVATIDLLGT